MELEDIKKTSDYAYSIRDDRNEFYDEILSYPPEKRNDKWSVSWSDLMMTMFIFFVVMYLYQTGNRDLLFGKGPGKNYLSESGSQSIVNIGLDQNPSQVYDQTRQAISEVMVTQPDSVELMKNGAVRIVLAGDLLFDPGKVDLKVGARYQLNQIARVLNENDFAINVVGHTDDAPTRSEQYPTNWELSSKRAAMVARYLTEVTKVDEKRVFISAYSYHQPVRSNDTAYNRALNRRVEIILTKQQPPYAPSNN
ncbi:MAG: OmpA family protein [Proteobacteria bacterium]|nr:OmpA family protein [Pseudomonadota bacterium]MBU1582252.1 OmpA family protein [Pseudomonadota bacterium]MBU2452430.1 OmpA family protein [Pseudomonadota bacterium]MBU2632024.1 OmpA family protein [Pseudomonadota bacterium]